LHNISLQKQPEGDRKIAQRQHHRTTRIRRESQTGRKPQPWSNRPRTVRESVSKTKSEQIEQYHQKRNRRRHQRNHTQPEAVRDQIAHVNRTVHAPPVSTPSHPNS